MERPEIKNYFPDKANIKRVHSEYTNSPHLYSYASSLDRYIDYLEGELTQPRSIIKEKRIEKLNQLISRTDKTGNEKVEMLIEMFEKYANKKVEEEKEDIRNYLEDEGYELLAEGI